MSGAHPQHLSAVEQDMKGTFTSSCLSFGRRSKVLQGTAPPSTSCLLVVVLFAQWNLCNLYDLACSQLSESHGPRPKMIYTRCSLNINHRAEPSCKTDVKQENCTVVVLSRGRGYMWTWFIYFVLFYVYSSLAALIPSFSCILIHRIWFVNSL